MKKILGIIPSTLGFNASNPFDDKFYVQNTYLEKLNREKCIPIILAPTNLKIDISSLEMCDSFLIIGGKNIHEYHLQTIDYAFKTNKKLLGICMGMQAIAMYANKETEEQTLNKIDNHYFDNITHKNKELLVHDLTLNKDSKLYNLIGSTKIKVNSIHNYKIKKILPPFKVVGKNGDVIEAIEYKNIIGVQFHPELMKNTEKLFDWLIL